MRTSDRPIGQPGNLDGYAEWDAAYVLGALSPVERLEFESHLSGCPACRSAVTEIAHLPGLLSQAARRFGPVRLLERIDRYGQGIGRVASSRELPGDDATGSVDG